MFEAHCQINSLPVSSDEVDCTIEMGSHHRNKITSQLWVELQVGENLSGR
jgi:hypothetical protein